jgi:outer membrane cobalamin receptor
VALDGRETYAFSISGVIGLESVVVTALGVERDEKSLGYAIQKLEGTDIAEVPSTNVVNGLNGKLAGVNIQGSAAGPTASANITIRGENSLSGDNQALFVVNGIPNALLVMGMVWSICKAFDEEYLPAKEPKHRLHKGQHRKD